MKSNVIKLTRREQLDDELKVTAYVTDQLSDHEKREFELDLLSNPQLKAKLHKELELKNLLLDARMPQAEVELNFSSFEERLHHRLPFAFKRLKLPLAAAAIVLVMFGLVFINSGLLQTNQVQVFETLTTNAPATSTEQQVFNLIFNQQASVEQRTQLMNKFNLTTLDQKSIDDLGLTRIRVTSTNHLTEATINSIQQRAEILFFEPVRSTPETSTKDVKP